MKFNIIILTTILLVSTFFSCKKDEMTNQTTNEIVDVPISPTDCWAEVEDESTLQFAGTNHTFCFVNETDFTLELKSWTDIVIDINTPSEWSEYIKGTYVFTNDSFEIEGFYMDSDFMNFVNSPSGVPEYTKIYGIKVVSETELILDNNDDFPYLGIRLLK